MPLGRRAKESEHSPRGLYPRLAQRTATRSPRCCLVWYVPEEDARFLDVIADTPLDIKPGVYGT